ncbi:MAG: serine hydrolase [Gemmatimonadota bacterium]
MPAQQAPAMPADVDRTVRALIADGYTAGMEIGLISPAGISYFGYGKSSPSGDAAPDENTVYEIGSISKVFTGTLLADMVLRGEVGLEDPIQDYLPAGVTAPTRGGRAITLESLATHRSGLPRVPANFAPADFANPYADYTPEKMFEFLSGYQLPRDIGSAFEYSNYGMGLLGYLLARHEGKTYEGLLESRIADPLGLTSTVVTLSPELRARMATPTRMGRSVSNWDFTALAGAGGIRSTARDMAEWIAANMGLRGSTLQLAMALAHQPRAAALGNTRTGLGWIAQPLAGHVVLWHNGGTGGYRSFAGFTHDGARGVVVLSNSVQSVDDIGLQLLVPSTSAPVDSAAVARYTGWYALPDSTTLLVEWRAGQLTYRSDNGERWVPLARLSEAEFERWPSPFPLRVTFLTDTGGAVTGLELRAPGGTKRTARRVAAGGSPD